MAELVIQDLEDDVVAKLWSRAQKRGCSMEEEVVDILRNVLKDDAQPGLGTRIAARFAGIGLTEEIPEQRGNPARPAEFD